MDLTTVQDHRSSPEVLITLVEGDPFDNPLVVGEAEWIWSDPHTGEAKLEINGLLNIQDEVHILVELLLKDGGCCTFVYRDIRLVTSFGVVAWDTVDPGQEYRFTYSSFEEKP